MHLPEEARRGYLVENLELEFQAAVRHPTFSPLISRRRLEIIEVPYHTQLYVGSGDLNSGPQSYLASVLSTQL